MNQSQRHNYLVLSMTIFFVVLISVLGNGQSTVQIEGTVILSDSQGTPVPGTIRWTGSDFQGWNGHTWVSLSSNRKVGSITDIHGNVYPTMVFGNKEWTLKNLNVTKYNDGSFLPNITLNSTWIAQTKGAWCNYNNNPDLGDTYGKLYNQFAVESGKLCPIGWHVPTIEEWVELWNVLGGQENAGGVMKDIESGLWNNLANSGNNESGFSAIPGGGRISFDGSFRDVTRVARFRTHGGLVNLLDVISSQTVDGTFGASVRCVK